jgi:hypothetical protein
MTDLLGDPAAWTTEQWLAFCILAFILLAILVMIHRLLTIMKISRKQTYRPNFRRLRRFHATHARPRQQDDEKDG